MSEHERTVLADEQLATGLATLLAPGTPQPGRSEEAARLIAAGRFVEGKVDLISRESPAFCSACEHEGRRAIAVVDGATTNTSLSLYRIVRHARVTAQALAKSSPWASMCLDHFERYGVGLGLGVGQVLVQAPYEDWPEEELQFANIQPHPYAIGYARLLRQLHLKVLPHHRWSFLAARGTAKEISGRYSRLHVLRASAHAALWSDIATEEFRWSSVVAHLSFALKHEGVNLEILDALFARVDPEPFEAALAEAVVATPTGSHLRRLWSLYELLTGRRLPLDDASTGNYVPLLDPKAYFVGPERRSTRHRVVINLLGTTAYSPTVRRTIAGPGRSAGALADRVRAAVADLPPETLRRAAHYLYTKETRSSFAIEKVTPSMTRQERFVWLLEQAHDREHITRDSLIELQNAIVDERFADRGWRDEQVYVGDVLDRRAHRIHYVAPRPEELESIMSGFLEMLRLNAGRSPAPLAWAAVVSYGFDFIHPFQDGNGRVHRWLIHWVLARNGVAPEGAIIPISAVMLQRDKEYDASLEAFSRPLLQILDYTADSEGIVTVAEDLSRAYRYFDATPMAEWLSAWFDEAVDKELASELRWLDHFDQARSAVREIVDLPDRLLTTFIRCCLDNGGRLSKRKRQDLFYKLHDDEIGRMEEAVASSFGLTS